MSLAKANRKLTESINSKHVYLRDFTNDDMERSDENDDAIAELGRQIADLTRQVDGATDPDEIKALRRRLGDATDDDERQEIRALLEGAVGDPDERKARRAEIRQLASEVRRIQALDLGLFIEDSDGNQFDEQTLLGIPVRVRQRLSQDVTRHLQPQDGESPTRGARSGE